jgi:hypothetical protein
MLFDFALRITDLLDHRLPALCMVALPASIAIAAAASLRARSDLKVLAWVQLITSLLLAAWMASPWHPTDPDLISMNRSVTLFTFGYVLQDWLREVWRSNMQPRWAHRLVIAVILASGAALIHAAYQS